MYTNVIKVAFYLVSELVFDQGGEKIMNLYWTVWRRKGFSTAAVIVTAYPPECIDQATEVQIYLDYSLSIFLSGDLTEGNPAGSKVMHVEYMMHDVGKFIFTHKSILLSVLV